MTSGTGRPILTTVDLRRASRAPRPRGQTVVTHPLVIQTDAGLYVPEADLYIDPRCPVHRAVVTTRAGGRGQWVPTLVIFGLYNKIVKELGHDRTDRD